MPVIEPVARAHGAELVDVELKNERGGWVLRVLLDRAGSAASRASVKDSAVDLGICSNVSRDLSTALDVADPIPFRYTLEVGSPGVERALRSREDYVRFLGEKVKAKLATPVDGQAVLVGELSAVEGDEIVVTEGSRARRVRLADVVAANLVFEMTKAEPPKGPKKKAKGAASAPHGKKASSRA